MAEDTDADDEQYAWASQTPTTRIRGTPVDVFTPQQLSGANEQTDSTFAVVLENPETVIGETYANNHKPDSGLVRDAIDEDSTTPTDYRVADASDEDATVVGDTLATDEKSTVDGEQANQYDEGSFEDETVVLWLNGLSGERIIRHLDFNGRPYAKYTDNGPVYGLFQAHDEWFEDGADRGQLAAEGKAPRVARPPILRDDISEVLIDVSRGDGRAYHGHVFRADEFADEFGSMDTPTEEIPEGEWGLDAESELDLAMAEYDEAEATVSAADWDPQAMFHEGDGWGEIPDDLATNQSSGMSVNASTGSESPDDSQQDSVAVETIVEAMEADEAAHGSTPDEYLDGGLIGFVESNAAEWQTPPSGERLDDIRGDIYERVSWLDAEALEA